MEFAALITIFATFLWGITDHIDKFMLGDGNEPQNNVKTLLVFSTLITGIILSPIWLILNNFSVQISTISLVAIFLSASFYIIATLLYFYALQKNDASIVVTMFQLIPVFSYIIGLIFFKEKLTTTQIIGSIIIVLSAILISLNFEEKNNKDKWKPLILMTLSSFCSSIYFAFFDLAIRNSSYNSCAFWYQVGFLIIGLLIICFKSYRDNFIYAIKTNGKRWFSLNIFNEGVNLVANLLVNYANVTIPLAIANVLIGFQGAFVFILGYIGVKLLPKYFKENISKKMIIQKVFCIALSIIGLIIMFN